MASTLSGLSFVFDRMAIPDPTKNPIIRVSMMRGLRNLSQVPDQRLPLTEEMLLVLTRAIREDPNTRATDRTLLVAMLALGFYACLRPGEMVYTRKEALRNLVSMQNISFAMGPNGAELEIKFERFKHSRGPKAISLHAGRTALCPVLAVRNYITQVRGIQPGALFLRDGRPVSRDFFATAFRKTLQRVGLDPSRYTPHSLRIGGTTHMARLGASDEQVRAAGRWASNAWRKYVRIYNT